jgi:hypothetical protein
LPHHCWLVLKIANSISKSDAEGLRASCCRLDLLRNNEDLQSAVDNVKEFMPQVTAAVQLLAMHVTSPGNTSCCEADEHVESCSHVKRKAAGSKQQNMKIN